MPPHVTPPTVGRLIKDWREARAQSQLDLALDAGISQRHLSFIESGRSNPSREMILRLSRHLDVPLRERNALLLSAGHAPVYRERRLDHPDLAGVRQVIDVILKGHAPNPALVVDRQWTLVSANEPAMALFSGIAPDLLRPPVNVLRVSLHPDGLAPRIVNAGEWRAHVLERLERQVRLTCDPAIRELRAEIAAFPTPTEKPSGRPRTAPGHGDVAVPLQLETPAGVLSLISTTTVFGTAVEITLSELVLESFYPADTGTAQALRTLAAARASPR